MVSSCVSFLRSLLVWDLAQNPCPQTLWQVVFHAAVRACLNTPVLARVTIFLSYFRSFRALWLPSASVAAQCQVLKEFRKKKAPCPERCRQRFRNGRRTSLQAGYSHACLPARGSVEVVAELLQMPSAFSQNRCCGLFLKQLPNKCRLLRIASAVRGTCRGSETGSIWCEEYSTTKECTQWKRKRFFALTAQRRHQVAC